MENLDLLIDLHLRNSRQGPGSEQTTQQAINLGQVEFDKPLKVADIGCGTGASTLQLAQTLNAQISAVDFLPEFIERLRQRAEQAGVMQRIETLVCSMDDLPFEEQSLDLIWSEGAIYNMGFEKGINYWRRFLKPGGLLVVSEISWLTASRPEELEAYWNQAYPQIATAGDKIQQLEQAGYTPVGYFPLPETCWLDNYYAPLQRGFVEFLNRHEHSQAAKEIVAADEQEIALYQRFKNYYSYGMYLARKTGL